MESFCRNWAQWQVCMSAAENDPADTDELREYRSFQYGFPNEHHTVNHSKKEYVRFDEATGL